MNENPETVVTQAEMDAALNPEIFSGAELRALKKLDEKNVDAADLTAMLEMALIAYQRGKANGSSGNA